MKKTEDGKIAGSVRCVRRIQGGEVWRRQSGGAVLRRQRANLGRRCVPSQAICDIYWRRCV